MIKNLLVIFVLCGITLQIFNKAFLVIDYQLNTSFITSKFCENKDKPRMHCEGKCHLNKQLKSLDKSENAPVNNVKVSDEILLFASFEQITIKPISQLHTSSTFYREGKAFGRSHAIFHPPQDIFFV